MAVQNQVTAEVIFGLESTFGTAPAAGLVTAKKLRRVSTSLALGKDIFQSAEARPEITHVELIAAWDATRQSLARDNFIAVLRGAASDMLPISN